MLYIACKPTTRNLPDNLFKNFKTALPHELEANAEMVAEVKVV